MLSNTRKGKVGGNHKGIGISAGKKSIILPSSIVFNSSWQSFHITPNVLSHSAQKMSQLFNVVLNLLSRINFTTLHQRRKGNDVESASTLFPSAQFTFIQNNSFHHSSVTVEEIFLYPKLICFRCSAWNSCFKMGGKMEYAYAPDRESDRWSKGVLVQGSCRGWNTVKSIQSFWKKPPN